MERDVIVPQKDLDLSREPDETSTDSASAEVLECGIGGCRFGVLVSDVIETDEWVPDYLMRQPGHLEALPGNMFFNGTPIPVIDLRLLFHIDEELPVAETPMSMVVSYENSLFVILLDGLLSIERIPDKAFQSFTSLYVSGVKWLSGAFILEDRAIPMLDLKSLVELIQSTSPKS